MRAVQEMQQDVHTMRTIIETMQVRVAIDLLVLYANRTRRKSSSFCRLHCHYFSKLRMRHVVEQICQFLL